MTETPPTQDQDIARTDVFTDIVVAFLAPIFLMTSGGNVQLARMAAFATVNAYRTSDPIDLMAIAQIIACNFSALGSLGLAMAEGLSLSMVLRLRGNAVALNRAIDHNRRALREPVPHKEPPALTEADTEFEAQVNSDVAAASQATAQARASFRQPQPQSSQRAAPPAPSPSDKPHVVDPAPPQSPPTVQRPSAHSPASARPNTAQPAISQSQWQSMWASAMTEVAGECLAELPNLPPAERKLMTNRAKALSSTASQLLTAQVPTQPKFTAIPPPRR